MFDCFSWMQPNWFFQIKSSIWFIFVVYCKRSSFCWWCFADAPFVFREDKNLIVATMNVEPMNDVHIVPEWPQRWKVFHLNSFG